MPPKGIAVERLQMVIRRVQSGFSAFYAATLDPHGVSFSQFTVLMSLAQEHSRKMSDVAKLLRVTLPAVTKLIDRLEQRGFVRRKPHTTDRRITLVDLSPKGLALVEQTQGRTLRLLTQAVRGLSIQEQQAVVEFMEALGKRIWTEIDEQVSG